VRCYLDSSCFAQDGGVEVNTAKADIDSLTQQLQDRKQAGVNSSSSSGHGGEAGGVLDDEQYQLMQQLKAAKAR
jgi:hypothetical protein